MALLEARGAGESALEFVKGKARTKGDANTNQDFADSAIRGRRSLWTTYQVRFDFVTKLCSSVPADPALIEAWQKSRQPRVKPPGGKSIEEIQEEVVASLAEPEAEEQYSMLVFQRDNGSLVMRAATIRAHLKDCARVLSAQWIGKIQGERSFATKVLNGVYPDPMQWSERR